MQPSITDQVVELLNKMPLSQQQKILQFAKDINQGRQSGTPGKTFLQFAGMIPADDLALMQAAIEEDCGQVDLNEW